MERILRHTAGYAIVKKKLRHPVQWAAAHFQHFGAYSRRKVMTTETKEKQERVLTDYKGKEENLF